MPNLQLVFSPDELLASDPYAEPLFAGGRRCHGGFDADGVYRSPRTRYRMPAIRAWQAQFRADTARELIHVPLETWPENYPNVAQAKLLLRHGVRDPMIAMLTRIGTVEGFGAFMRYLPIGDIQHFFLDDVSTAAIGHLDKGLIEAHSRDEAGWGGEVGHDRMWFAARDIAFENPLSEDQTALMLDRMGVLPPGDGPPDPSRMLALRMFDDLDFGLELLISRMIAILLIEVQAYHTFIWAETILSDKTLVAGEGDAATLVGHIRQDETPHVEYLRTAISEMRERTFVGTSGQRIPGHGVVDALFEAGLEMSLGQRRHDQLHFTLREIERACGERPGGDSILGEFNALATLRQDARGTFVAA